MIFHKRKISKKFSKIFWYVRFLLFDILIIFSINNNLSLTWQFQNKIIISFLFSQIKYYFVLISLQNIFNLSCINILVSLNLKYIWILILWIIILLILNWARYLNWIFNRIIVFRNLQKVHIFLLRFLKFHLVTYFIWFLQNNFLRFFFFILNIRVTWLI